LKVPLDQEKTSQKKKHALSGHKRPPVLPEIFCPGLPQTADEFRRFYMNIRSTVIKKDKYMDTRRSNPKKAIDSLLELFRNQRRFGQPNCDHCVDFLTAIRRIDELSYGVQQWTSSPVMGIRVPSEPQLRGYLVVCYANPDPTGLPNHLCFRVPLVTGRDASGRRRILLACFSPESIMPLSRGSYWEDHELKYDALEDWIRFWKPLRRCFWPDEDKPDDNWGEGNQYNPEVESLTLAGTSYKDSINALICWLSQTRYHLKNE
jgi:hypothetical protein